ncbi:MAG: hypothetical protein ABIJ57_01885 [Pseudomonadota bacterium]
MAQKAVEEQTSTQVIQYNIETAIIAELDAKYKDVQEIKDETDLAFVKGGQKAYREIRLAVDLWHKTGKADIVRAGKAYDAEKKRAYELFGPGEEHLKEVRQEYETKIQREEMERTKAIHVRIAGIKAYGHGLAALNSQSIAERIDILNSMKLEKEIYMELLGEAMATLHNTKADLDIALKDTIKKEDEEAERKAESERLEKVRQEQAEGQRFLDEAAARHQRKVDEANAKAKAQMERMAEQQRQLDEQTAQLARDKQEEADRREREAEQAKLAAEAKEKAEKEAKERAEQAARDRIEAEKKAKEEAAMKEALKPDIEKLEKIAQDIRIYANSLPELKSEKARQLISKLKNRLQELAVSVIDPINFE